MNKKVLLVSVLVLVFGGFFFLNTTDFAKNSLRQIEKHDCISNPNPIFTHFPTDMTKVTQISPPIMKVASGVKGHSYINVTERVPIYAPVDATLTSGTKYRENLGGRGDLDQYTLRFDVSCEVWYFFDHLIEPIDKIAVEFPGAAKHDTRSDRISPVEIKGGEFLGYSSGTGEHNWDFGVINMTKTTSLKNDPKYMRSEKFDNADCPYSYYEDPMRQELFDLLGYGNASDLTVIDNLCEKYL